MQEFTFHRKGFIRNHLMTKGLGTIQILFLHFIKFVFLVNTIYHVDSVSSIITIMYLVM